MKPEEVNKALAEKVMGWIVAKNPYGTNELWLFLEDPNIKSGPCYYLAPINKLADWDPWTRIDHVLMCLEKSPLWTVRKDRGLYQCMVRDEYTYYSEWGANLTATICDALIQAVEENGGKLDEEIQP